MLRVLGPNACFVECFVPAAMETSHGHGQSIIQKDSDAGLKTNDDRKQMLQFMTIHQSSPFISRSMSNTPCDDIKRNRKNGRMEKV